MLGSQVEDDHDKKPLPAIPMTEISRPEPVHDVQSVQRLSGSASPTRVAIFEAELPQRKAPSVELPTSVSLRNSIDIV